MNDETTQNLSALDRLREDFEQWATAYAGLSVEKKRGGNQYRFQTTQFAWGAWIGATQRAADRVTKAIW